MSSEEEDVPYFQQAYSTKQPKIISTPKEITTSFENQADQVAIQEKKVSSKPQSYKSKEGYSKKLN